MKELEKAVSARAMQALDLLKRGKTDEVRVLLERLVNTLAKPEKRHILAARKAG